MTQRLSLSFSLLILAAFTGCSLGESTRGDLDQVDFSYRESCFWGCDLDQPVLSDSRERISVTGSGDAEGITVGSSDPGVATFLVVRSCDPECNNEIVVKTHSVGDAKLELYSQAGDVIDRTTIRVRAAGSVAFQKRDADGELRAVDRVELTSSESVELWAEPMTDDGVKLLGNQGFDWQSTDVNVASFEGSSPSNKGRSVQITTRDAGTATLNVTAGGGSGTIEVVVVEGK